MIPFLFIVGGGILVGNSLKKKEFEGNILKNGGGISDNKNSFEYKVMKIMESSVSMQEQIAEVFMLLKENIEVSYWFEANSTNPLLYIDLDNMTDIYKGLDLALKDAEKNYDDYKEDKMIEIMDKFKDSLGNQIEEQNVFVDKNTFRVRDIQKKNNEFWRSYTQEVLEEMSQI